MDIRELLLTTRRIALVGASDRPDRASNDVMKFLLDRGYDVTPVNPTLAGKEIHGRQVVASLEKAKPLDMVDVFRRSEQAGEVMDEAVSLGARSVWLQLGIVNEPAAGRAKAKGVEVVMDDCPKIAWARHRLPSRIG
ncbi:CoA-binding protein [Roseococcus sp. YIM B11640]|uniref:CoA-binding protein n=1 Tax=Roseococcus sp. YIM B11640 TaxID=3133973 RepID=UPI003C7B415A